MGAFWGWLGKDGKKSPSDQPSNPGAPVTPKRKNSRPNNSRPLGKPPITGR